MRINTHKQTECAHVPVNLTIANDYLDLPQGFAWVCTVNIHTSTPLTNIYE